MAHRAGYWTEIKGIKLDDATRRSWIQVVPLGKYEHQVYGTLDFTVDRLRKFESNFKNNVRTAELDVDYDHKERDGKAAGWYKDVEVRDDGLWAEIEWTPTALASLQAGEYRYFSPEFSDEWTDPKSGQTFEDVLFGGAITNRPFLRDILPINLSEVVKANEGDNLMDPKELRKLLGLPEDASDEDTNKALAAALSKVEDAANDGGSDEDDGDSGDGGDGDQEGEGQPTPPQERQPAMASELKKLAEDNPAIAKLLEEQEAATKRLATLEAANRLSEVNRKLTELQTSGKFAIPPAVQAKIRDIAVSQPDRKLSDNLLSVVEELTKAGLVPLSEVGSTSGTEINAQPSKKFNDLVEAKMKDGKTDYVDAVEQVGSENPQLWEQYRRESFLTEESS